MWFFAEGVRMTPPPPTPRVYMGVKMKHLEFSNDFVQKFFDSIMHCVGHELNVKTFKDNKVLRFLFFLIQ